MPALKLITEVLYQGTKILISESRHPLAEEIVKQLQVIPDVKIFIPNDPARFDLEPDQVSIVIHLAGFDSPSLAKTLSHTSVLHHLLSFSQAENSRFILIIPEASSPLSQTSITLTTQYGRNFGLDYLIIAADTSANISQTATAIIRKFIYGYSYTPPAVRPVPLQHTPRPAIVQNPPPHPVSKPIRPPIVKQKRAVVRSVKFPKLTLPSLQPPKGSVGAVRRTVFSVLLIGGGFVLAFCLQAAILFATVSCSANAFSRFDITKALKCSRVSVVIVRTLSAQSQLVPGSRDVFRQLGYPLSESAAVVTHLHDTLVQLEKNMSVFRTLAQSFWLNSSSTSPDTTSLSAPLSLLSESLAYLQSDLRSLYLSSPKPSPLISSTAQALLEVRNLASDLIPLTAHVPQFLAHDRKVTYAVLIQDNTEIRPTGGFLDSFVLFVAENGRIISSDIYTSAAADSQLRGHVDPPVDFVRFTREQNWYLRDSNWDPDFPSTAKKAAWFIEKELGRSVDVVIGTNLSLFKEILAVSGSVKIPELNITVDETNLEEQYLSHLKSDSQSSTASFLPQLTTVLIEKSKGFSGSQYNQLLPRMASLIQAREITISPVSFTAPGLDLAGWSGGIALPACKTGLSCVQDLAQVVDTNVGVNKADAFVKRSTKLESQFSSTQILSTLTLNYRNESLQTSWPAGNYRNYVRVYLPPDVAFDSVEVDGKPVPESDVLHTSENGLVVVGYQISVSPGSNSISSIKFHRNITLKGQFHYQFHFPGQPGTFPVGLELQVKYPQQWYSTAYVTSPQFSPFVASPGSIGYNTSVSAAVSADIDFSIP